MLRCQQKGEEEELYRVVVDCKHTRVVVVISISDLIFVGATRLAAWMSHIITVFLFLSTLSNTHHPFIIYHSLHHPHRRWSVNLNLQEHDIGYNHLKQKPSPVDMRSVQSIKKEMDQKSNSSSYSIKHDAIVNEKENKQALAIRSRKQSKAFSIALSPGKQIAMNAFMMYMSGRNLNIFSISILSSAILSPIKVIMNVSNAFRSCEDPDGKIDLTSSKALFILMNLVWLGVGLYKMATMKLLPLTSADWEKYVVWKHVMETSSIPPV